MKFACEFFKYFYNIKDYDELLVSLAENHDVDRIEDFFKQHPKQTIVIQIMNPKHFYDNHILAKLLKLIPQQKYNWKLKLQNPYQTINTSIMEECAAAGVPYMFNILIDSWEVLYGIIKLHPSDVYITNSLAFDIQNVGKILHEHNIKVRLYPNITQSAIPEDNDVTTFFIRPEDTPLYENYVDIMEFFTPIDADWIKSFYLILYANAIKWQAPLNQIILGLEMGDNLCPNQTLVSFFGSIRLKCKRECKQFKKCQMCYDIFRLGKILTDNNYKIVYNNENYVPLANASNNLPPEFKDNIKKMVMKACKVDELPQDIQDAVLENLKKL